MRLWVHLVCYLAAAALLGACTRVGFGNAPAKDGNGAHDGPVRLDKAPVRLDKAHWGLDGVLDSEEVDGSDPLDAGGGACSIKTTDGLFLNPGCDPDVSSNGPTVIANAPLGWVNKWGVFSAAKWWVFDPTVSGGQGAFVNGGKSLAQYLQQSSPACTVKTTDGLPMNPGCDLDVQSDGFTSMVTFDLGGNTNWLVCHKKKWWVYDPTPEAGPPGFVQGGKNLASFLMSVPPDCSYKTREGTAMNPGCDPDVQAEGFSAMGMMYESGSPYWFATAGKKWWLYSVNSDAGPDAFVAGGLDVAAFLLQAKPGCATKTKDGLSMNPGCDPDVKSKGLTDLDVVQISGKTDVLLTYNTKWWLFDLSADGGNGAFVEGGKDVTAFFKGLKP